MTDTHYITIGGAIADSIADLLAYGSEVDAGHWQGVPTEGKPDLVTKELLDVSWAVRMPETESAIAEQTGANLPWAEDHFQERVSRVPSNPGEQYKKWPFWGGQRGALTHQGPDIDERDWAYLAALIDGDGSISFKDNSGTARKTRTSGKYRICIGQKEGEYLHGVAEKFPDLGIVRTRKSPSKFGNFMTEWTISRKQDLLWCLPRLIPYLLLKRDRAEEALEWTIAKGSHGGERERVITPMFSHTYQERFWGRGFGERYTFGNLDDVVTLLHNHPQTRQATFPIFSREDTGAAHGGRVPCTLHYHFLRRNDQLHLWYAIRSCDAVRHFRDDIYMAVRLCQWVLNELKLTSIDRWHGVTPGYLHFSAYSFHAHKGDIHLL